MIAKRIWASLKKIVRKESVWIIEQGSDQKHVSSQIREEQKSHAWLVSEVRSHLEWLR